MKDSTRESLKAAARRLPIPLQQILRLVYRTALRRHQAARGSSAAILRIPKWAFGHARRALNPLASSVALILTRRDLQQAQERFVAGDLKAAQHHFAKAFKAGPIAAEFVKSYAEVEWRLGNFEKVVFLLNPLHAQFPGDGLVFLQLVKAYFACGQNDIARTLINELILARPAHLGILIDIAHYLRESGSFEEAVSVFKAVRLIGMIPGAIDDDTAGYIAAASEYAGFSKDAEEWTGRFERWRERCSRRVIGENDLFRPMSLASVTNSFGDLAERADAVLKLSKLNLIKPVRTELFQPPGKTFANLVLAEMVGQHLTIHNDPQSFNEMAGRMSWFVWRDFNYFELTNGEVVHYSLAYALAETEWQKSSRKPLFQLPEDVIARGRETLSKIGLARDDWFVTLHVREAGYYSEQTTGTGSLSSHRNADIGTYEQAIRWILDQGGWVFRLGDPSMPQAAFKHERFVDYAHSSLRSDWMDMFLIGASRYLVSTNSGPMCVATTLGTPTCVTNYIPFAMPALSPKNICVPKMLWWRKKNRYLTFAEMVDDPFRMANRNFLFTLFREKMGIELVENSPEDILACVREIHCATAGQELPHDPRHAILNDIFARTKCRYISPISSAFIEKSEQLGCLSTRVDPELYRRWGAIGSPSQYFTVSELVTAADFLRGHDARQAALLYEDVLTRDAKHPTARSYLALCFRECGRFDEALAIQKDLLAQHPTSIGAYRDLNSTYRTIDNYDEALAIMENLLARWPNSIRDWLEYAHQLREAGRIEDAIEAYRRPANLAGSGAAESSGSEGLLAAACQYAGAHKSARIWVAAYERYRDNLASSIFQSKPMIVSLGRISNRIGDIAARFDLLKKGTILGMLDLPTEDILVDATDNYANGAYVELWRNILPFAGPERAGEIRAAPWEQTRDLADLRMRDGRTLYYPLAYSLIQQEWLRQGREPLITISPESIKKGWRQLKSLGLKDGDWFVALHVREGGYFAENIIGKNSEHTHRSATIDNYQQAIDWIIAQGGWVVRIGDPTMVPLPSRRRLIDYALSDIRSPEMDCFLLNQCRYLLGTNSGSMAVATSFGVVCGITNYIPIALPVCSPRNIMLPKMIFSRRENRYLTVDEMMAPPLGFANRSHIYQRFAQLFDAELLENTPEEILAFTQDLHSWAQSNFNSDDPRHRKIQKIMQRRDGIYVSPFAKSWLDRYEPLGCLETSQRKPSFEAAWKTSKPRFRGTSIGSSRTDT